MACCLSRRKKTHIYGNAAESELRLEKIDLLDDEGAATQNDLWQLCFREKIVSSTSQNRTFLSTSQENISISMESCLRTLNEAYAGHGFAKYQGRIKGILEAVQPFVSAVDSLVQNEQIASLVWGSLMILFQVGLATYSVLAAFSKLVVECSEVRKAVR